MTNVIYDLRVPVPGRLLYKVLEDIAEKAGFEVFRLKLDDLAAVSGMSKNTISTHVRMLHAIGLIEVARESHALRFRISNPIEAV